MHSIDARSKWLLDDKRNDARKTQQLSGNIGRNAESS